MRWIVLFAIFLSSLFCQSDSDGAGISAATRLNMLRLQRMEIIKALGQEGVIKSPQQLTEALKSANPADTRLVTLNNLNSQIHELRIEAKKTPVNTLESSERFGLRYRENQQKIEQYKRVYQNAKGAGADADALKDLQLMQKRLYMERSDLTLRHQILEDGVFPSVQKLNQGISSSHSDPRVRALAKLNQDMGQLEISRSQSNRVGHLTRQYKNPVQSGQSSAAAVLEPAPLKITPPSGTVAGSTDTVRPPIQATQTAQTRPAQPLRVEPAASTVQPPQTVQAPAVPKTQTPVIARPQTVSTAQATRAIPAQPTVPVNPAAASTPKPVVSQTAGVGPATPAVQPLRVGPVTSTVQTPQTVQASTVPRTQTPVVARPQTASTAQATRAVPAQPAVNANPAAASTPKPVVSQAIKVQTPPPSAVTPVTAVRPAVAINLPSQQPVTAAPYRANAGSTTVQPAQMARPPTLNQPQVSNSSSLAQIVRSQNAFMQPRGVAATGFNPAGMIESSIGAEIKPIATELQQGIKTNSIQDYIESVKTTGNKVTDKVLGGAGDEATGRDGYEVRRDSVVKSLQEKVTALADDIATAQANGNSQKAQKLQSLKDSLDLELKKAQVSPQGIQLQAEISTLKDHIGNLKSANGDKTLVKSLQDQLSAKEAELGKLTGDSKAVAKNYIRDGLHFAVISAATQGVLNIIDQVKSGEEVNVGNAFDFITTPDFLLGTTGAFAGGLVVQKALTTGMGKIAMATVQNMVPGPIKFIVQALPYTIGAMVGSDLMTGNLGRHSVTDMVFNGIGSSVGMMLGSAIFPPIGSIAGSVLGAMAGDYISKMIQGNKDQQEMAVDLAYEPQWQELKDPAWEAQDTEDLMLSLHPDPTSAAINRVSHPANSETLVDLQKARDTAYEAYKAAASTHGQQSEVAQRALTLYQDFDARVKNFRK